MATQLRWEPWRPYEGSETIETVRKGYVGIAEEIAYERYLAIAGQAGETTLQLISLESEILEERL